MGPQVRFDVISEAFAIFSQRPGAWILASLPMGVVAILYFVGSLALGFLMPDSMEGLIASLGIQLALYFGYGFVYYVAIAGLMRIAIMEIRGIQWEPSDAFKIGKFLLPILGASIGMGVLAALGFAFCCVPGFIIYGLFMITYPLIMDQNLGGATALQRSWEILRPHLWQATAVSFVLIMIVSILSSFVVGVVIALPVWALGMALVYRDVVLIPNSTPVQTYTPGMG